MAGDTRFDETFYGIYYNDWTINWGSIASDYLLVKNYIDEYTSTTSYTSWLLESGEVKFLYPHNIKKKYFIEGVIEGELTFYADGAQSYVTDYRVTIFKEHEDTTETELATTGSIITSDTIASGDDIKYHFWIDVFASGKEVGEKERLGLKIQWNENPCSTPSGKLSHWNDSATNDIWVKIPFLFGD